MSNCLRPMARSTSSRSETGGILVFSVHATLTKTLPNNPKIGRSLPKVGKAITKFCGGPSIPLGITGHRGGSKLCRGERLAACPGDVGVSEFAGGCLSRASQRNDDWRGGLVFIASMEGGHEGKCDRKEMSDFHFLTVYLNSPRAGQRAAK